jgi:hypothetical protein
MQRDRLYYVEAYGSGSTPGIEAYPTRREAAAAAIRKVRYPGDASCIVTADRVEQRGPNLYWSGQRIVRTFDASSPFTRRARAGLLPAKAVA